MDADQLEDPQLLQCSELTDFDLYCVDYSLASLAFDRWDDALFFQAVRAAYISARYYAELYVQSWTDTLHCKTHMSPDT